MVALFPHAFIKPYGFSLSCDYQLCTVSDDKGWNLVPLPKKLVHGDLNG